MIETEQPLEFNFNGKKYCLTYDRAPGGKKWLVFGEQYVGVKYDSYGELMNNARVENCYFRELIPDL